MQSEYQTHLLHEPLEENVHSEKHTLPIHLVQLSIKTY